MASRLVRRLSPNAVQTPDGPVAVGPTWRKTTEPYATAWRLLVSLARNCGLVHAMDVFDDFSALRAGVGTSPADLADLVANVVEAGELVPGKVCFAQRKYGHSLRAFRGLMDASRQPSAQWCPADAHLWTYLTPEEAARIAAREAKGKA